MKLLASTDCASQCDVLLIELSHAETQRPIEIAEELANSSLPQEGAIARLQLQAWLVRAVNHDQNFNSIVGNLLGSMNGVVAIPAEWLAPLALHGTIIEIAEEACAMNGWHTRARPSPATCDGRCRSSKQRLAEASKRTKNFGIRLWSAAKTLGPFRSFWNIQSRRM